MQTEAKNNFQTNVGIEEFLEEHEESMFLEILLEIKEQSNHIAKSCFFTLLQFAQWKMGLTKELNIVNICPVQ